MRVYLDESVTVALLVIDPHTARAEAFLRTHDPELVVSDFAATESAAVIAKRVRTRLLTVQEAHEAFAAFDAWASLATQRVATTEGDLRVAETLVRRLDLALRAPDALNLAIAIRAAAAIATFDLRMAASARTIGAAVAPA